MLGLVGLAQGLAARREAAEGVIADLMAHSKTEHVSPLVMALVYAGTAERNKAFEWLERAL